tara:strand:+ start:726 stop:1283 length:558 start_codon:yes stop_codon:yes gene_type:complete
MASYLTRRLKLNKTDIRGINNAFLRVKINRETGAVKKVNEGNWTEAGLKHFNVCYPNAMTNLGEIKFRTKKSAPTQAAVFETLKTVKTKVKKTKTKVKKTKTKVKKTKAKVKKTKTKVKVVPSDSIPMLLEASEIVDVGDILNEIVKPQHQEQQENADIIAKLTSTEAEVMPIINELIEETVTNA